MKFDLSTWGPVTVLLVAITVVAAVAGAVICIVHPETLTFEQLLNDLEKFAIGLGLLGVGRGVASAGKHVATAQAVTAGSTLDVSSNDLVTTASPEADQGDVGHA